MIAPLLFNQHVGHLTLIQHVNYISIKLEKIFGSQSTFMGVATSVSSDIAYCTCVPFSHLLSKYGMLEFFLQNNIAENVGNVDKQKRRKNNVKITQIIPPSDVTFLYTSFPCNQGGALQCILLLLKQFPLLQPLPLMLP